MVSKNGAYPSDPYHNIHTLNEDLADEVAASMVQKKSPNR